MSEKILKGITWGHTRGLLPMQAIAQRFSELHPGVEVHWHKRSLQEFADFPIEKLTTSFDLLVIDHPWVGTAASTQCVLPLDDFFKEDYLQEQLQSSVGGSHQSYHYANHQWALAIDAAAPAASFRADLLAGEDQELPSNWQELLQWANKGKVAVPAIPIDLLMNFYSFCLAFGEAPFSTEDQLVADVIGLQALECMRELYSKVHSRFFSCNPIAVAEIMTKEDQYIYCPFAYCYSNYAREGYAKNKLVYTDVVALNGARLQTTLGGTGLAVSSTSSYPELALEFARFAAAPETQAGIYTYSGGQPGHANAWQSEALDNLTGNFFTTLRPLMERSYHRPRYHGYLHFQDRGGDPVQEYLLGKRSAQEALRRMNNYYKESIQLKNSKNGQ